MKRLFTVQLVPGMIVAEDVLSLDRQLILSKGTVLTDNIITRLDLYGILTVQVEDKVPEPTDSFVASETPSYYERVRSDPAFQEFKREYELNISSFKDSINRVVTKNCELDFETLLNESLNMISSERGHIGLLDMLQNMRDYDDSTYAHCLNVGLLCNLFARWLKWPEQEIELATACGLFHDVGKLLVPHHIINKPGKLSEPEFAQVQKHPASGYRLLANQKLDNHICNAALMHHERYDGSGYPLRLNAGQIDRYAGLVAITDVYDAMTAARVYRGPLCPFRVIEIFEEEGFQKYNVEYLLVFLENVVNTYLQTRCRLSDGREGEIIYINRDKLSRPIVQCGSQYVNLAEEPELIIQDLL